MAQSTDLSIANQSGSGYRGENNSIIAALASMHLGSADPEYIVTGMIWGNNSGTPWVYKVYDGEDKISFMEVNAATNKVNFVNIAGGDARDEAPNIGQVQDGGAVRIGSISGTNAITGSLTPAITAYASGQQFSFIVGTTNTSTVTININSLGAKAIQKNGAVLVAGDLTAGDVVLIEYDGTQFQLLSPARTPVLKDGAIKPAALDATVQDLGEGSGTRTIDLNNGRVITLTSTGNTTIAFSNVPASGQVCVVTLKITNGGAYTLAFPSGTRFPGATVFEWTASGTDEISLITTNGGTNWDVLAALNFGTP